MKIRLCVVSPLYHSSLGGLGRQAKLLTERLAKEDDIELFVIARRMKGMPPDDFSPEVKVFRAWSIKPYKHTYERFSITNLLISLTFTLSCAFFLVKLRRQYDIVHFHGASLPLFLNYVLLRFMKKKIIAKVAAANIGTEAGSLKGRYYGGGNLVIRLIKNIDAFIAISEEIKEGLIKDGFPEDRIVRISNFIDTGKFDKLSSEERMYKKAKLLSEDKICILFSGRFIKRKGVEYLLEAWKAVSGKFGNARLYLLGNGPLFEDMKGLANMLSISDKVVFKGHINNVVDYLNASDIFVLPSLQEGMPNALLEAMACGLPPVATRIGGVEDIIQDEYNGILVKPEDAYDLAEGIIRLIEDEELRKRISENAYRTIKKNYSLESVVPKYIKLYRELLGNMI